MQRHYIMPVSVRGDCPGRRDEALAHFRRCMELAPDRQAAALCESDKPVRAPDHSAAWILSALGRHQHGAGYPETAGQTAGLATVTVTAAISREEYGQAVRSLEKTFQVSV